MEGTLTTAGMTAANPIAHETLRRGDLAQLANLIESHRIRTIDLGATGRNLYVAGGNLIVQGVEPIVDMSPDGVTATDVNGSYAFGERGIESLAARINVPGGWLAEQRTQHPDLFDTVVGYALRGEMNGEPSPYAAPDGRKHTIRLLTADPGADGNEVDGMVRAVLGGSYLAIDNIDILSSIMEGMADAGVQPGTFQVEADLTETRMVIKIWMPELYALAPAVFRNYRSPYSDQGVDEMPKVFAGMVASNSEVGQGAWSVAPRIVFEACSNGTTISKDALRKKHVGGKLEDDGVIQWSGRTQRLNLEMIRSQTADAVRTFADVDYVTAKLTEMAQAADAPVKDEPEQAIMRVTRHTATTQARSAVLDAYLTSQDFTAGGVMQAFTAAAQRVPSADVAYDLETKAVDAMTWMASRVR
jgi:hypothetical protein